MRSKRLLNAKKTKILLLSKIRGLGKRGESILVSNGYFRNYLFPRKLACKYEEKIEKELKEIKENHNFDDIKNLLQNKILFFVEQANTLGVLFNSIKRNNILENILKNYTDKEVENFRLKESLGKCRVSIDSPIKNIGTYNIVIELGEEIINMKVSVATSLEEAKKGV